MRRPTQEEEALVRSSLDAVERGLFRRFLSGKDLAVVEGERREVVLADPALWSLPSELLEGAVGGLRVGLIDDGFAFDLQGALVYARETQEQTVRVNEKATRMFVYGRDVLGDSVLGFSRGLRHGDHCIVVNPRREAIGIGQVVGRFKGPGPAVRAVHDLGSYLRDQ